MTRHLCSICDQVHSNEASCPPLTTVSPDAGAFRQLNAAHVKIGEVRRIVEEFWSRPRAADAYERETTWAMHVALVKLAEVLKRNHGGAR